MATAVTNEVKYIEITNAKIAYQTFGNGDPLILCIGYAANMDLWSTKAIEILQQKYKVFIFDYRGMGFSTNSETSITINTLSNDLNQVITKLNLQKINLLGWSMGGFVAQMFAINYPEKVNKLILYATNFGDAATISPTDEIVEILSNPDSNPIDLISTLFPDEWLAINPEPWKFLPQATEPYNGDAIGLQYMAIQKWLSPGGGTLGNLNKLTMPVLVICGKQDKVVPAKNSKMLADSIRDATLVKVAGTGHGFMYQLPALFSNYILTFLSENSLNENETGKI